MPPKKFYAVWAGHKPGIYTTWAEAEKQVKGYPKAGFKSFSTRPLAEEAFANGTVAPSKPALQRKPAESPNATNGTSTSDVDIFCDGACNPNPGQSGTGIAIYKKQQLDQLWYGLHNRSGTNNTAELLGLYHSLIFAKAAAEDGQSVTVHCDSKYSIDCVTTWASGWKAKGWKKKSGEIKNLDIIKPAHTLYLEIAAKVQVQHVKGHAGIEGNELADRMSVIAIERQEAELSQYTESLSIPDILALARG
ncbi:MAG: ribonuclease H family protein [Pseudomonadales bacterium]